MVDEKLNYSRRAAFRVQCFQPRNKRQQHGTAVGPKQKTGFNQPAHST